MPFFLLLSNIYFIGILSSWCQSHSASLIFLWHRQEMSASQALVSHCQGSSRCLGNLYFFFSNLVTRNKVEREKSELRPVVKAKKKRRILVMWQVKKRASSFVYSWWICAPSGEQVHRWLSWMVAASDTLGSINWDTHHRLCSDCSALLKCQAGLKRIIGVSGSELSLQESLSGLQ